jgi:hypothetical protein
MQLWYSVAQETNFIGRRKINFAHFITRFIQFWYSLVQETSKKFYHVMANFVNTGTVKAVL